MATTLLIHEVIELVNKQKTKEDKIKVLKQHESWALKDIIRGSMDTTLNWNLPVGAPPYTPCTPESTPATLLRENTKFKYFVKGGPGTKLPSFKRMVRPRRTPPSAPSPADCRGMRRRKRRRAWRNRRRPSRRDRWQSGREAAGGPHRG